MQCDLVVPMLAQTLLAYHEPPSTLFGWLVGDFAISLLSLFFTPFVATPFQETRALAFIPPAGVAMVDLVIFSVLVNGPLYYVPVLSGWLVVYLMAAAMVWLAAAAVIWYSRAWALYAYGAAVFVMLSGRLLFIVLLAGRH